MVTAFDINDSVKLTSKRQYAEWWNNKIGIISRILIDHNGIRYSVMLSDGEEVIFDEIVLEALNDNSSGT